MLVCSHIDLLGIEFDTTSCTSDDFRTALTGLLKSTWCGQSLHSLNTALIALPISSQYLPGFYVRFRTVDSSYPAKPSISLNVPYMIAWCIDGYTRFPGGYYAIKL